MINDNKDLLQRFALSDAELDAAVADAMGGLGDTEIENYVATGEPLDKAGAYAVQGEAGRFAALADRAATLGGLNAQGLRAFRADGGMEALRDALESMHARLSGR